MYTYQQVGFVQMLNNKFLIVCESQQKTFPNEQNVCETSLSRFESLTSFPLLQPIARAFESKQAITIFGKHKQKELIDNEKGGAKRHSVQSHHTKNTFIHNKNLKM